MSIEEIIPVVIVALFGAIGLSCSLHKYAERSVRPVRIRLTSEGKRHVPPTGDDVPRSG